MHRWKKLLLCAVLEFAALSGAPLRPKDIDLVLRPATAVATQDESEVSPESPPTD